MYTLYIDTHYINLVIALYKDNKVIAKKELSSNKHSSYTVPTINDILKEKNITIKELNEVIVINGPGSFTGVRIGILLAKILGYTLNIPIKSISYLT